MNLVHQYKSYVKWCDLVGAHPIGFVAWKGKKFNMKFNRKNGKWEENKSSNFSKR